MSRYVWIVNIFCSLFLCLCMNLGQPVYAQSANQQQITALRQQMAKIRQTTNWNNAAEAKKANEQIKALMKKLMELNSAASAGTGSSSEGGEPENKDAQKINELQMAMAQQRADVYNQIWEAGSAGKSAPVLLAQPIREEIIREFKEDESQQAANAEYLQEKKILVLDLSMPGVDLVIGQMEHYQSIQTLVITGGKNGAVVDLNDILAKAAGYPLRELLIINFKLFVRAIPDKLSAFDQLEVLALYNNHLEQLPESINSLTHLSKLYLDMNPLQSLNPLFRNSVHPDTIGLAKTSIPVAEQNRYKQLNPQCQLLTE